MELFVVGHELGHLFHENKDYSQNWSKFQNEAAADEMAVYMIYNDAVDWGLPPGLALAAPRLLFLTLGFLEDQGSLPRPVDHLPSTKRAAFLGKAVQRAMKDASVPKAARDEVTLVYAICEDMSLHSLRRVGRFLPKPWRK